MKKKIPYIIAMILMIPFFVLAALSLGAQRSGNCGKEIVNTNMSWTVVKEDGVLEESEGMPIYVDIEKDGRYNLSFSWGVEEPGFLTAITIKDENGKYTCIGDPTEGALTTLGSKCGLLREDVFVIECLTKSSQREGCFIVY